MPSLMELTCLLHKLLDGPYIIAEFCNVTVHDALIEVYSRNLFHDFYTVSVLTFSSTFRRRSGLSTLGFGHRSKRCSKHAPFKPSILTENILKQLDMCSLHSLNSASNLPEFTNILNQLFWDHFSIVSLTSVWHLGIISRIHYPKNRQPTGTHYPGIQPSPGGYPSLRTASRACTVARISRPVG